MSKVTIKALDSLSHGGMRLSPGETAKTDASTAKELEKAGLVEVTGDAGEEDEDEGGQKAVTNLSNKSMGDAAHNKATQPAAKTAKK